MVENSKEELDFTEFRLMGRTKKVYKSIDNLTVFENVASFLELLLIHLPISWKILVFDQKTYTREGLVISRKRVLLDYHSSFDTLDAKRVLNTQNVYEPLDFCWKFVNCHENTIKLK